MSLMQLRAIQKITIVDADRELSDNALSLIPLFVDQTWPELNAEFVRGIGSGRTPKCSTLNVNGANH